MHDGRPEGRGSVAQEMEKRGGHGASQPDEESRCPRFCRPAGYLRDVETGPPGFWQRRRKGV